MSTTACSKPRLIVTDGNCVLLTALDTVSPTVPSALRVWHIMKDFEVDPITKTRRYTTNCRRMPYP
ncbi:hypothetical protein BCR43DRAFT_277366 [Syncephalastrum racemosum]|uniref:Uncharacterized protein n=1 Tax=Syncephalastrum racemosum TaxID=13706 RepID=A0A1X2HCE9_SYNRA|nr:hypothetical protein BCR43DRAFT_277366 [Syncephalastrum racemosum]